MKQVLKTFPHFQILSRTRAAFAVLALSAAHVFGGVVNATYSTGAEVPVTSNGFNPSGQTVELKLNYAPTAGTQLMVVRNTAPGIIRGTFANLAQGQTVALSYGGATYHFVANYHGGHGQDLVLLWTDQDTLPAAILNKLDPQIVLALKQSRREPPFDKPTSLAPDLPIKDGERVLADIEGALSQNLSDQIALNGGKVIKSPHPGHIWAMVPLSQLETLASRLDVNFISPARPTITSRVEGIPGR